MSNPEYLGQRAKARRQALRLQQTTVAKALGVCNAWVSYREKSLPLRHRGDRERVWEELLRVPRGWLRDASIPTPDHRDLAGWEDLEGLAQRFGARRRELGFSRESVARIVGVTYCTIFQWEIRIPLTRRLEVERRLEIVLRVPRGWLRDVSIPTPAMSDEKSPLDLRALALPTVADEIRTVGIVLSQFPGPGVRVTRFAALAKPEKRRATMFANRYGVAGRNRITLQASAKTYGLTRERVRQIIDAMKSRASGAALVLPKLARLKKLASNLSAVDVVAFEKSQRALLGTKLALADVDRFAQDILGSRLLPAHEEST